MRSKALALLDKTLTVLIVISGTAIFGRIGDQNSVIIGIFVSIIATTQLVFDFRGSCNNHDNIRKMYFDTLLRIEKISREDSAALLQLNEEILKICSIEPTPLKVLELSAHNRACDALGYPRSDKYIIPWYLHNLSGYFSFDRFKLIKDVDQ